MDYPTSSFCSSLQKDFVEFCKRKNIQEQCTEESLLELKNAFWELGGTMDKTQLKSGFSKILQIFLDNNEFEAVFKRINAKNDELVTWDEFISYLLLEMRGKDVARYWQPPDLPISGTPIMKETHHRKPICKIAFCPEILSDGDWNFMRGCYLTLSKDGNINYWSIDMKYKRSVKSTNPFLKIQTTMVTDMIVMPDIQIVCTSSIERDLRFYDTVGNRFDLRVMITNLESAVVCMSYYFSKNKQEESFIILGDMSGGVKTMSFYPENKGPFKHFTEQDVLLIRYQAIIAGELKSLKVKEFNNLHSNWVCQVAYYESLRSFISCSKCSEDSLIVVNPNYSTSKYYKFNISKGVNCFTFCEESQILVTGGIDCAVRVWNPFFPKKVNVIFYGHQAPISVLFIHNQGKRIFSLSQDRCIKVFEVFSQSCIQSYSILQNELGYNSPLTAIFNDKTQKIIIANQMIAILVCGKVIDKDVSDGYSHTKSVSCVIYNHLFKVIVSTDLDSCITVWNPWYGHRVSFISKAHNKWKYGDKVGIEITAACFDDSEQLLVTGARDGSIKLWQFNTGNCIREMIAQPNCEVTGLTWHDGKILSVGWDRVITEFTETELGIYKKYWQVRHSDDITCISKHSQALVTASFNGEIILWRLETGQPYRFYLANDPTGRKIINFRRQQSAQLESSFQRRKSTKAATLAKLVEEPRTVTDETRAIRPVRVSDALFLNARPMAPDVGTLMIALGSGLVQVWTHHPGAGFLGAFSAVHKYGDFVTSMATDHQNEFLITGHELGYIKVWLIKNYMLPNPPRVNLCALRLEFPFLWKDRFNGRAKRAIRDQPLPLLLSSVGGHKMFINDIQFIPRARIIISGCSDQTIKLWTLGGRYISTLGTFKSWAPIFPNIPVQNYFTNFNIPPEVKNSASFTTMKVLQGGEKLKNEKYKSDNKLEKEPTKKERFELGSRQSEHSAMRENKFSNRSTCTNEVIIDSSTGYIPVYNYLKIEELQPVETSELFSQNTA